MRKRNFVLTAVVATFLGGCATAPPKPPPCDGQAMTDSGANGYVLASYTTSYVPCDNPQPINKPQSI